MAPMPPKNKAQTASRLRTPDPLRARIPETEKNLGLGEFTEGFWEKENGHRRARKKGRGPNNWSGSSKG